MTQLEAINEMLAACQEAPVNSLSGALPSTASRARACLSRVSRQVQTKGWTFNTDRNRTLARNNAGEVVLPTGTLKVEIDLTQSSLGDGWPVHVGNKVYDQYNQTYVWNADLIAFELVLERDWDDIPPVAQQYITRRACRTFQDEFYGASELRQAASQEELLALKELRRTHGFERKPNLITNDSTWNIIGGGRGINQR